MVWEGGRTKCAKGSSSLSSMMSGMCFLGRVVVVEGSSTTSMVTPADTVDVRRVVSSRGGEEEPPDTELLTAWLIEFNRIDDLAPNLYDTNQNPNPRL